MAIRKRRPVPPEVLDAEERMQNTLVAILEAVQGLATRQEATTGAIEQLAVNQNQTNERLDNLEKATAQGFTNVNERLSGVNDRLGRIEELLRNGR